MMHLKIREIYALSENGTAANVGYSGFWSISGRVDASAREKSGSRLTFEAANTRSGRAANA